MILRARVVLPVSSPPIENGAVVVSGDKITAFGAWNEIQSSHGSDAVDLGDSVLLPGLINAHCHLDYSDMAGLLTPARSFSDWIKSIVALKADWSYTEFASSWINGAKSLLSGGCTTVLDIEAVPELIPEVTKATALRVFSTLELISVRRHRSGHQMVSDALSVVNTWPNERVGLSPHAPYTTSADLLASAAVEARRRGLLLTTHIAESHEEFEMFTHGRGPMFDWLCTQRNMRDCGSRTPVEHIHAAGLLGPDFLAVHCNYVTSQDIDLLAASGSHVVHCPRSHDYFGRAPFPYEKLRDSGINVSIGTDSMASVHAHSAPQELDMFAEMRRFASAYPQVSPEEVLRLSTLNGAAALGRAGVLGEIRVSARADLIAVPLLSPRTPAESLLAHLGPVQASMIGGSWAISPAG